MNSNRGHASATASIELLVLLSGSMGRRLTSTTRWNPQKPFTSFPLCELHQAPSLGGALQDKESRPVVFLLPFPQKLDTWLPSSPFVSRRQHLRKDTKAPYFPVFKNKTKQSKNIKLDLPCLWVASNRAGPLTTDRVSRGLGGRLPASRGGSVPRRTEHPPARPTVLALLADPGSGSAGLNDYRLVLERVGRRGGSSPRLRPPGKPPVLSQCLCWRVCSTRYSKTKGASCSERASNSTTYVFDAPRLGGTRLHNTGAGTSKHRRERHLRRPPRAGCRLQGKPGSALMRMRPTREHHVFRYEFQNSYLRFRSSNYSSKYLFLPWGLLKSFTVENDWSFKICLTCQCGSFDL